MYISEPLFVHVQNCLSTCRGKGGGGGRVGGGGGAGRRGAPGFAYPKRMTARSTVVQPLRR